MIWEAQTGVSRGRDDAYAFTHEARLQVRGEARKSRREPPVSFYPGLQLRPRLQTPFFPSCESVLLKPLLTPGVVEIFASMWTNTGE